MDPSWARIWPPSFILARFWLRFGTQVRGYETQFGVPGGVRPKRRPCLEFPRFFSSLVGGENELQCFLLLLQDVLENPPGRVQEAFVLEAKLELNIEGS